MAMVKQIYYQVTVFTIKFVILHTEIILFLTHAFIHNINIKFNTLFSDQRALVSKSEKNIGNKDNIKVHK